MKKTIKIALLHMLLITTACKTYEIADNTSQPIITYQDIQKEVVILPIQKKFGELLAVPPLTIQNIKLYEFIEKWLGVPYKSGGENENGIDASAFTQLLFSKVYDNYIERTIQKQFESKKTDKFRGKQFLKEGDFVFFIKNTEDDDVLHDVGIYLNNDYFIHASAYRGATTKGVQLSNLNTPYWGKRFVAAGRRLKSK